MPDSVELPDSPEGLQSLLSAQDYVANRELATAVFAALRLSRPLLLEGDAGVGKTELALSLAKSLGRSLIRLQCYEGLDLASSSYEWNYARQLLAIRLAEARGDVESAESALYSEQFLIERPLLRALRSSDDASPVLLIDEVDRADEPFEAYLLELLSDYQMTIPELGTIAASVPPIVILTSNRTRDVHDALRRRCFYHWLEYPDEVTELDIVSRKAPDVTPALRAHLVRFVQRLRGLELYKAPGVAETIDWARTLQALGAVSLSPEVIETSLGALLKYQDDVEQVRTQGIAALVVEAKPV